MSNKNKIRILNLLAAMILVAGLAVSAYQVFNVKQKLASVESSHVSTSNDLLPAPPPSIQLADFDGLWDKRLQGRPVEPKKPELVVPKSPKAVVKKQPRKPKIKLPDVKVVGVLHSESYSLAMLSFGGKSQLVTVGVGETVDEVKIVKIEPDRVIVNFKGLQEELKVNLP